MEDGEVGHVIQKHSGSNEILYQVELSRGAKGWVSRPCIERSKIDHGNETISPVSTTHTDCKRAKTSISRTKLKMRIKKLEKQKYRAVQLQDFVSAQRIKKEIIALRKQIKRLEKSKEIAAGQTNASKSSNSVHVFGTAIDKFEPQNIAAQDLVVGHQIPDSEQAASGPMVSFDDGHSWKSFPLHSRTGRRRSSVCTRGVVFNLGFGSFSITEHMGGRHALKMNGFELEYCKLTPKDQDRYDHHIYESHARKNLYDYAREKIVPLIRRLARRGRCPVALLCGSRGGQETLQYVWRNCYRGPTICLNASCVTTSIAETYAYRGVHYTMNNAPCGIPLVVTSSDNDEVGFTPELGHEILELYRRRGHPHLIAQYHCSHDSHVPESVPRRLGLLVRVALDLSTCTSIPRACALTSVGDLVRSFTTNSYAIMGGVKI